MRTIYLPILCLLCMSCKREERMHNFVLYEYQNVPEDYAFNGHSIVFENKKYLLTAIQEFQNDTIIAAGINKPEDIINYTRQELEADTALMQLMNFSMTKTISVEGKTLKDNGELLTISQKTGDSLFCLKSKTLRVYKIKD